MMIMMCVCVKEGERERRGSLPTPEGTMKPIGTLAGERIRYLKKLAENEREGEREKDEGKERRCVRECV
jgi:hypothetical protein